MPKNKDKSDQNDGYWHCFVCGEPIRAGIYDNVVTIGVNGVTMEFYSCSEKHTMEMVQSIFDMLEEKYCDDV